MTEIKQHSPSAGGEERPHAAAMVESVLRCKWSLQILGLIRRGVSRPGAIKREIAGLTTKVQNDSLQRLVQFGIVQRTAYPEVPPRVEYTLTESGGKLITILDAIEDLQAELNAA